MLYFIFLLDIPPCTPSAHYSTHLNEEPQAPTFKKGAAFLFKHQAVTSESESKVRVFTPFPKLPHVNLTELELMLPSARGKAELFGSVYRHHRQCEYTMINETYGLLLDQSAKQIKMIKTELKEAEVEESELKDITRSFLPRRHQQSVPPFERNRRFVGAVAALAAGAGLVLGDPVKDAACTALSIFNLCDDESALSKKVGLALQQQKDTLDTLQRVQTQNDENFFLLGSEVKKTQDNVKEIRDVVGKHLKNITKRFEIVEANLFLFGECRRTMAQHSMFLQEIRNFNTDLGSLYTHIKAFRAAFYAYKINLFSTISSLASGHITPQFLLPDDIAAIVRQLAEDEVRRSTKLSPAIQPGTEAIYYEIQMVLEITLIPSGISVVLGIPMNSKSSTFDIYKAIPLHQPNGDNKTASLFSFAKPFLAVSTDNTRFAELDSSTLQQCSGNNRIKLCRKGFSTTTDETLLCLGSLLYNYDIPALRNCIVKSVLLPDAPQAFYLADGLYHVISRDPLIRVKNDSRQQGVTISNVHCQACVLRPSCSSSLSLNQGDLVLSPDMDFCETQPEPFYAKIELTPSLEQVFRHVPQVDHAFPVYSAGEARQSILNSVRMELAELPEVHRMSPESVDKLTRPIAKYYSSISPATSEALESYLPFRTAVIFSTVSITLSLLTFTISFTLFRRKWKQLFLHPNKFFSQSHGRLLQIRDAEEQSSQATEDDTAFLTISYSEFQALKALASETIKHSTPLSNYASCSQPPVPPRVYPEISAPQYSEPNEQK